MKNRFNFVVLLASLWFASAVNAAPTLIKWLGHAAFQVTTPKGHVLLIDPWITNPLNPDAQNGKNPLDAITKADYILVSHGHFDHIADAVAIGKKTKARLVGPFELVTNIVRVLGYPKDQIGFDTLGNVGGESPLADGEVVVGMVPAVHSSGMDAPDAEAKNLPMIYGGSPVGFVIRIQNGPTIYHTGDTAYYSDMNLIGQAHPIDLALINIGGHFGMSLEMAAKAAKAVGAKVVVPHHYKTFPVLTQDAKPFLALVNKTGMKGVEMAPGSTIKFEGSKLLP